MVGLEVPGGKSYHQSYWYLDGSMDRNSMKLVVFDVDNKNPLHLRLFLVPILRIMMNNEMNPCVSDVVIQSLGDLQKNDCSG